MYCSVKQHQTPLVKLSLSPLLSLFRCLSENLWDYSKACVAFSLLQVRLQ